jgi:hypothetical protein
VINLTGTGTWDGGDLDLTVAKTDGQVMIPIAPPVFVSGTWTVTESTNVPFVTRTPANTTEYYTMPIIVPSRTTALKGIKLKSVTVVVTLGGTLNVTDDDFQIDILKVTTPVDAATPVGSILAGDDTADYAVAQNTKAKRLTAATHTFIVNIPTGEQVFCAVGEQYYARILIKDNANADLTCILKGAMAQFDMIPL